MINDDEATIITDAWIAMTLVSCRGELIWELCGNIGSRWRLIWSVS